MAGVREFLNSTAGKATSIGVTLAAVILAVFMVKGAVGENPAVESSTDRVFIDNETGQTFRHKIAIGEKSVVMSPFTHRETGVMPEPCYWTKDGKAKSTPTYVLMNSRKAKPEPEPTFCPDCGRLVVGLNPAPMQGSPPPPTKEEYEKRKGN
jgi:hypothetical protein